MKGKRKGHRFVGAYVDSNIKNGLKRMAKKQDRSVSYVIEKILVEGVKHLEEQAKVSA